MSKPEKILISDFKFIIELDTRWADMDWIGHVNNATFLTYIESARIKLIEDLGFLDVPIIMASIKIDYINKDTGEKWIKDTRKLSPVAFLLSTQYLM